MRGLGRVFVVAALAAAGLVTIGAPPASAAVVPIARIGTVAVQEGDAGSEVIVVPVDLSQPTTVPVSVNYTIKSGTANPNTDFLAMSGKLTLPAGMAAKYISVTVFGDGIREPNESVLVALSSPVNATIDPASATGVVTIRDDDFNGVNPAVELAIGDAVITEADGGAHTVTLPLTLNRPATKKSKVHYALDCGPAFPNQDYVLPKTGLVTFAKNTKTAYLTFFIPADQKPEVTTAVLSRLRIKKGPVQLADPSGSVTILDDDNSTNPAEPRRVSVSSAGLQAEFSPTGLCKGGNPMGSNTAAISGNGRYVAFQSDANNLVPGDTNGRYDVFVRDLVAGTTQRVSVTSAGAEMPPATSGPAYTGAEQPAISADGRYVVFYSRWPLVPGLTMWDYGIYLHDRVTHQTELVSRRPDGTPDLEAVASTPSVSDDGRYVAYGSADHVYVRDRSTGTTILASVGYNGSGVAGGPPVISGNGRYVSFDSQSNTVVPGDTNGCRDTFVRDLVTGTTERVSITDAEQQGVVAGLGCPIEVRASDISSDGRYVTFTSILWNLDPAASPPIAVGLAPQRVYLRDRLAGTTRLVDDTGHPTGPGNINPYWPSVSDNGRYVTYQCVCDSGPFMHVFRKDFTTGETERLAVRVNGTFSNGEERLQFSHQSLSGDGATVVYTSYATNLVPEDTNNESDIYVQTYPYP